MTSLAPGTQWSHKPSDNLPAAAAVRMWTKGKAVAAVAISLPSYRTRFDFTYGEGIARTRDPSHAAMTAWLRDHTNQDAVILGTRGASLQIIGPAGRRVVAVNANWSNPYVDPAPRVADRESMLDALETGEGELFTRLADRYRVTHVVGVGAEQCDRMMRSEVELIGRIGEVCAFSRILRMSR